MSKELTPLQAVENLTEYLTGSYRDCFEELSIIKTALKEYERLKETLITATRSPVEINKENKVLEIIKKRKVRIGLLFYCDNASQYNHEIEFNGSEWQMLTQEEFELLKEALL